MAHGTVDWFQIDASDPKGAQQFYGELFNWTYEAEEGTAGAYQQIRAAGADHPQGGIADTGSDGPNRATFFVVVSDVVATAEQAERLGGKVVNPPTTTPTGLSFAHLLDPSGNHFGIYTPPGA